jgi:hypothetical protein
MINCKVLNRRRSWADEYSTPAILLEVLRKTTKFLSLKNCFPDEARTGHITSTGTKRDKCISILKPHFVHEALRDVLIFGNFGW